MSNQSEIDKNTNKEYCTSQFNDMRKQHDSKKSKRENLNEKITV